MSNLAPNRLAAAPRVALLMPIAFMLHFAEEWFGGLSAWTLDALGNELSSERLVLINAIAFPIFLIGTISAVYYPRMAWFATAFAALLGLNGVLHALATLGLASYSPGTITGLILYLPLSVIVLRLSAARLSGRLFNGAVFFGFLIDVLISFLAFL